MFKYNCQSDSKWETQMPRIKADLAEGKEPNENESYIITGVTDVTSAVQNFPAYRIELKSKKKGEEDTVYATMAWKRETVGASSKLGCFMLAFLEFFDYDEDMAYDTDNWLNHEIRIVSWKEKNREIRVIE